MTAFDHFNHVDFASLGEEGDCPLPLAHTNPLSSTFASPTGGDGSSYRSSAARRLEESRQAFAWRLGRAIEVVPVPTPSTTSHLRVGASTSRVSSACSNLYGTSTTSNASCIPSLALPPTVSEKVRRRTISVERADVTDSPLPFAS